MVVVQNNRLLVQYAPNVDMEMHLARLCAVLDLIAQRHTDFNDQDTVYFAIDLVKDMLPTEAQWRSVN